MFILLQFCCVERYISLWHWVHSLNLLASTMVKWDDIIVGLWERPSWGVINRNVGRKGERASPTARRFVWPSDSLLAEAKDRQHRSNNRLISIISYCRLAAYSGKPSTRLYHYLLLPRRFTILMVDPELFVSWPLIPFLSQRVEVLHFIEFLVVTYCIVYL